MATETPSEKREGDQKVPKKGGKLDKYKWYLIGGLALVAALVFFFVNKSNASSQTQGTTGAGTPPGVDPQTGVPYSVEYGEYGAGAYGGFGSPFGGGGGGTGPAGPAGATGPAGSPGKRGKPGKTGPRGPRGHDDPHDKKKSHH
jgi:hypothetical protein